MLFHKLFLKYKLFKKINSFHLNSLKFDYNYYGLLKNAINIQNYITLSITMANYTLSLTKTTLKLINWQIIKIAKALNFHTIITTTINYIKQIQSKFYNTLQC